jgi:protein MpaA
LREKQTGLRATGHRSHDYTFLIRRWRAVAKTARLRMKEFVRAGDIPLFQISTGALTAENGIYISAGIHGDESAASEALITWAERHLAELRSLPLLLFPCLNPWGLVNNCRFDANGVDLNRAFHLETSPVIVALKHAITPFRFALALSLHEDFDGQGLYLYEVRREKPFWGEALLEAARPIIPIEGRTTIDGRKAVAGLIRRRFDLKRFAKIGYPEGIWLHLHHARRCLTLETPSEFAIEQRVAAQIAVIEECVRRVCLARAE